MTVIDAGDIAIGGAEYRADRRRWTVTHGLNAWTYDAIIGANTPRDPRGNQWLATTTRPTQIRVFSSTPVLGGARNAGILFR